MVNVVNLKFLILCGISTSFLQICTSQSIPDIPTPTDFFCWLLNITKEEIPKIIENFKFHDVPLEDISFLLYKKSFQQSENETISIQSDELNWNKETIFIVHGWQSSGTADFVKTMARSYHNKSDCNVVAVDWSNHSTIPYLIASGSTEGVGKHLGDFIVNATKSNTDLLKNIHIVGHSLGAHISGFAGERIFEKIGRKVSRITALDAASPLFAFPKEIEESKRISKGDAEYVDSLHTNIHLLGIAEEFADSDFYVEGGGPIQPGCLTGINIFEAITCSHSKSQQYFSETITNRTYEATRCRSFTQLKSQLCVNNFKALMGEPVPRSASGSFYIDIESLLSTIVPSNISSIVPEPPVPIPKVPVPKLLPSF